MDSDQEVEETLRHVFSNAETFGLNDWLNDNMATFNRRNTDLGKNEIVSKPL